MYKIYINERPLYLLSQSEAIAKLPGDATNLVARYTGNKKSLPNFIDMMEKSQRYESVTIFYQDVPKLIKDFEGIFKILEAGGGVVANEHNELLMIYRRGSWDLPKGKIDKGETKEEAAVREVQEETGVQNIELGDFICETRHTYQNKKGKRIIKLTYWYKMTTTDKDLIPQAEEDIEAAVWMAYAEFKAGNHKAYQNIWEVLGAYEGGNA